VIGPDLQRPHPKLFGSNALVVRLNEGDFVQQPRRAAEIGNVFRAVGEQHLTVDAVAIPVFAAGELAEFGFVDGLVVARAERHGERGWKR
jgi:hypothetical protein